MENNKQARKILGFTWNVLMSNLYNLRRANMHGINDTVHPRWLLRKNFIADNTDGYKAGFILERIDPELTISKDNVRWVKEEEAVNSLTKNYFNPVHIKTLATIYSKDSTPAKKKVQGKLGLFNCFCGSKFTGSVYDVNYGKIRSCGCMKNFHGVAKHPLYSVWYDMIRRCYDPSRKDYKHYGERGIAVDPRWWHAGNFIKDMKSTYKEGLTLDRINVNKDYSMDNCRFETQATQARNTQILRKDNKSGYRGVRHHNYNDKWIAYIRLDGKAKYLGSFDTAELAAQAYDKFIIDNKLEHTTNGVYGNQIVATTNTMLTNKDAVKTLDLLWHILISLHHNPLREDTQYKTYGICGSWLLRKNFINDLKNSYKDGYTLKRINDDEPYSMHNVKWVKIGEEDHTVLDEYKQPLVIENLDDNKTKFKCFCGAVFTADKASVRHGRIKSCGCLNNIHNVTKLPLYKIWYNIITKVYGSDNVNINAVNVCDRWLRVQQFNDDILPNYSKGLYVTRIDGAKDYCLDNIKLVTKSEIVTSSKLRSTNTSGYRGVTTNKDNNNYVARLTLNNKKVYIGSYATATEAAAAYNDYVIKHDLDRPLNELK